VNGKLTVMGKSQISNRISPPRSKSSKYQISNQISNPNNDWSIRLNFWRV